MVSVVGGVEVEKVDRHPQLRSSRPWKYVQQTSSISMVTGTHPSIMHWGCMGICLLCGVERFERGEERGGERGGERGDNTGERGGITVKQKCTNYTHVFFTTHSPHLFSK